MQRAAAATTAIAARQAMTSKHIQQCHVVAKYGEKNATKSFLLKRFLCFPCGGPALESSVTHTPCSMLMLHAPSPASTFSSLKPTPHAKVSSSSLPKSFVLVSKESEPRKGTAIALAMDGWGRANRNLRRCEDVQPK